MSAADRLLLQHGDFTISPTLPKRWVGGVRLQAGLAQWALDGALQPLWRE
ncbi:hypothetical protein [Pseudomonas aegrilactucae]|uniref:Uncharacterized protein n=1 Tax=Pseudomonas aegrilactucae TaxID=2854028 RepID=A0A9Q2XIN7_9PSED|nr:hypothetical protein [Pseudomonas aegrilactucae]MBV6287035.1 hypothetical protein [Pseudomonas aegrilactucae]